MHKHLKASGIGIGRPDGYRPDIDGLRAIAVLAVVLYHYGATWLPGGFTGVDVFFVISGYLITSIITAQVEAEKFSLPDFYARRVKRIMPALVAVLLATLAAGYWILWPGDYSDAAKSAAAAAVGLGNIYFWLNTGYFDQAAEMQPLLHTWSLGVEEQFYVFWPLLLWGVFQFFPTKKALLSAVLGVAALSFVASVWSVTFDPKTAFYLPHTRAWELALGGALALSPKIHLSKLLALVAGAAGLGLVVMPMLLLGTQTPFPGLAALPSCFGAVLIIIAGRTANPVSSAIANPAFQWVGRLSYSIYLWHWSVLVLGRHYLNGSTPDFTQALLLGTITLGLSMATYSLIEQPARKASWRNRALVTSGIAAMVTLGVTGLSVVASAGAADRIPVEARGIESLDAMWEWQCPIVGVEGLGMHCVFGAPWETATKKAILWGDSQAEHFAPLLEDAARRANVAVVLFRACPAIIDEASIRWYRPDAPSNAEYCRSRWERADAFLQAHDDVNLVLLAALWSNRVSDTFSESPQDISIDAGLDLLEDGIIRLADRWAQPARRFVVFADIPLWDRDPLPCARSAVSSVLRAACETGADAISFQQVETRQGDVYRRIQAVANRRNDVRALLPANFMCGEATCITELNGEFLYRDAEHLRRNLSQKTEAALADLLHLDQVFADSSAESLASNPDATNAHSSSYLMP